MSLIIFGFVTPRNAVLAVSLRYLFRFFKDISYTSRILNFWQIDV